MAAIIVAGFLIWTLFSPGIDETSRNEAREVFDQWDETAEKSTAAWNSVSAEQATYLQMNAVLAQAFATDDLVKMNQTAAQAQASLDRQAKLLGEFETQINVRKNVAANMREKVNALPQLDNREKLEDIAVKARQSNELMSESLAAYYQGIEMERSVIGLFTRLSQGQIDKATFTAEFNAGRNDSNRIGAQVEAKFAQASALEQETLGGSQYME